MITRFYCIVVSFLVVGTLLQAQSDSISLFDCYTLTEKNYPIYKQKVWLQEISDAKTENIKTHYLPTLNVAGQASYQSDVPKLEMSVPPGTPSLFNGPNIPKDQYKMYADVGQLLYDGGQTKALKDLERASVQTKLQEIEVELYQLKDEVNKLFFSILYLTRNEQSIELSLKNIDARIEVLKSGVANGAVLPANLDVLLAERLKLVQQQREVTTQQLQLRMQLSAITGADFINKAPLVFPRPDSLFTADAERPELSFFSFQQQQLDQNKKLLRAQRLPVLSAFGQFGYGQPGLNYFNEGFDSYYIVGLSLRWNVFDWNNSRRDRMVIDRQKQLIDSRRDAFLLNQSARTKSELLVIDKYRAALADDEQIIVLRGKVLQTTASQVTNGVAQTYDYVAAFNAELQARVEYNLHQIQLIQAQVNYLFVSGKLNKF